MGYFANHQVAMRWKRTHIRAVAMLLVSACLIASLATTRICTADAGRSIADDDYAKSCQFDGLIIPSGETRAFYITHFVPHTDTCRAIWRTCYRGALTGDHIAVATSCRRKKIPDLTDGKFRLYSAVDFLTEPELTEFGMHRIKGIYEGEIHALYDPTSENYAAFHALSQKEKQGWYYARLPDERYYKTIVAKTFAAGAPLIFIDVEATLPIRAIPNDGHKRCSDTASCAAETQKRLEYYMTLLRWAKEAAPEARIGLYLPYMSYAGSQPGAARHAYDVANIAAMAPLLHAQDILMPTLYLAYGPNDLQPHTLSGSRNFVQETLRQLRAIAPGKPILPFIMHEYSYEHSLKHKGQHIAFWPQLLLTYREAGFNGAILWGYDFPNWRRLTFDPKAPWWLETVAFARAHATLD